MLKIEYEIQLNEQGRPCIDLAKDYEHNPEDKFFAVELARYYLQTVFARMDERYDQHTKDMMDISIRLLGQIGDEMAEIIYNDLKSFGDIQLMMHHLWHVCVDSVEERNEISKYGIVQNNKLYVRQEGLKVLVIGENKIYTLRGGVENENWIIE
jgi:hypothetical protein